jgi:hypothetical protein
VGRADSIRLLPILDRFVEPDVEIVDTGGPMEGPSLPAEPTALAESDLAEGAIAPSPTAALAREVLRRRVSRWVAEDDG